MGNEVLLEQVQFNFGFRKKFLILLPFCLLVDNNTFSKMCAFKSPTTYTDYGGYENRNVHFLIVMKSKELKNLLVILYSSLLHNQNDGWTVPDPYLMVCCKNVI